MSKMMTDYANRTNNIRLRRNKYQTIKAIINIPIRCAISTTQILARKLWHHRKYIGKTLFLYLITILCLYAVRCQLPYSKLYKYCSNDAISFAAVKEVNDQRLLEAREYLSTLDASKTKIQYLQNGDSNKLRYVIGVVSVARRTDVTYKGQLGYLTQVMSKLHKVTVDNGATSDIFPFICNVDSNPEKHAEALELGTFFPNVTKSYTENVSAGHPTSTSREQEKQDYVFCLETALKYKSDYVILIQDDAYPTESFYEVLEHLLKTKVETQIQRGERVTMVTNNERRLGWIKLNIPNSATNYHRNWFFFIQWICLTAVIAGISCLIFHLCKECKPFKSVHPGLYCSSTDKRKRTGYISSSLMLLKTFVYVLLIVWIIGRPYYMKLRATSPYFYALEPGTSCCLVAVLYQPSTLPGLINYLQKTTCTKQLPLDFALDRYRIEKNLKQYLVTPNLFNHIGFYSALNKRFNRNGAEFVHMFDSS
ncbi:post-GPI attachment to proteins factor 4-like [Amphiura filiformis]|uniref:post-GPI attachment to proteins factor 4-like n=1 Tax=Amphiura filiformis TaxID=82378 RepID=UPI003B2107F1